MQTWQQLMQQGGASFSQQRPGDAIRAFDAACRLEPSRPEGWINLGVCLNSVGSPVRALKALENACELAPRSVDAQLNRGRALAALGRPKDAVPAFEAAVALERSALTLNDLACALRASDRSEEALALCREAAQRDSAASLPRVNLATCLLEVRRFGEAQALLRALSKRKLSPREHQEVIASLESLGEYQRLQDAVAQGIGQGSALPIEEPLGATPETMLRVDARMADAIGRYANSARALGGSGPAVAAPALPEDWSRIEGLFMVPVIENVAQYRGSEPPYLDPQDNAIAWIESDGMERAVAAARRDGGLTGDPVRDEARLRLWHGLACAELPDYLPGHFKLVRNLGGDGRIPRAQPNRVAGMLRELLGPVCADVPPGVPRALVLWMSICDVHPFRDGNGRVALNAMNRELENCGFAPALLRANLGIKGKFGAAMAQVRHDGGNLQHLLPVLGEAQEFAVSFCRELEATPSRGSSA